MHEIISKSKRRTMTRRKRNVYLIVARIMIKFKLNKIRDLLAITNVKKKKQDFVY